MIKNGLIAAAVVAAAASFATMAQAEDIPATPMNHGPMVMTGMGAIGAIGNLALTPANVIAQPVAAIGTPGAPEPAAAPAMRHHHRHHHMMMKKKMKKM